MTSGNLITEKNKQMEETMYKKTKINESKRKLTKEDISLLVISSKAIVDKENLEKLY